MWILLYILTRVCLMRNINLHNYYLSIYITHQNDDFSYILKNSCLL